jgi:hypothetical protein
MLPNEELPNPPVTKRRPNTAATLVEVGEEMSEGFTLIGNGVCAHSSGDLRMAELYGLEAEGALTAALRKLSETGETEASSLEPQFTEFEYQLRQLDSLLRNNPARKFA